MTTHGDVKIHRVAVGADDRDQPGTPDVGADAELFHVDLPASLPSASTPTTSSIRTWRPGQAVRTLTRS